MSIKAEEAKKHVEPPRLTTLVVSPVEPTVQPGKKQAFTSKGLDQHGHDIEAGKVAWTATGGTIDKDGVFLAGPDEGSFLVTASVDELRGTTALTIAKPGATPPRPIKPTPVKEITGISWEGEIPSQKWMNFYTKVLSKFAASQGLKLTVRFELASDAPISQQKIDETKAALRELGLDDGVDLK